MKKPGNNFLAIALSVMGLGLLAPATGAAFTSNNADLPLMHLEFENGKIRDFENDIEISILHSLKPLQAEIPRLIHPDVDTHELAEMENGAQ